MEIANSIFAGIVILFFGVIVFRASGSAADWLEAIGDEARERARGLRLKNDQLEAEIDAAKGNRQ